MDNLHRLLAFAALIGASLLGWTAAGIAAGYVETDLVANLATLTDANGIVHKALHVDPNLVNPWGVGESATSPFWVADNGSGQSTLYNTAGTPLALVVSIPTPGDPLGTSGAPTGLVFNTSTDPNEIKISGFTSANVPTSARAVFLFATEDGTILGWNPGVNPKGFNPAKAGTYAIIAVDNSAKPNAANGVVYKGLAIAKDSSTGETFLYATNFRAGTVDVFDSKFQPPPTGFSANAFIDPRLPRGYAPFDIVLIAGELFVTFAVQDAAKHDDVAGESHGIVDTFDIRGGSPVRFAQHGQLNSPGG